MVFLDQASSHKLLTHIFMLDIDTLQYLALHNLINIKENPDSIFEYDTVVNKDENELLIKFPEEHFSSDSFEILENSKNPNIDICRIDNPTSMLIPNPNTEDYKE